jgi:hypothetical protein
MRERKIFVFALISILAFSALSAGAPSPVHHLSEADTLNQKVTRLSQAGKYSEAIPIAKRVLELRQKEFGRRKSDLNEAHMLHVA